MKSNKGFTLIELMIVIAIIAIIAAIAIPNLMASRVRANEATAIAGIKQIATAQVTFQAGRQGRNAANTAAAVATPGGGGGPNGFCDNYRNLAFGTPVNGAATEKLALVSDVVGNAAVNVADGGGTTPSIATKVGYLAAAAPYQGFLFSNDQNAVYSVDFACYAVPNIPGTSGNNAYWVGQQGTVYLRGLPRASIPPAEYGAADTPQAGTSAALANWTTL